jgi:hypothetical protein
LRPSARNLDVDDFRNGGEQLGEHDARGFEVFRTHVRFPRGAVLERLDEYVFVGILNTAVPIEKEVAGLARVAVVKSATSVGQSSAYLRRAGSW